ncbi:MAG: hypothetical protein JWO81_2155 [Alphaproteobacteria bacterium]|nr:hypothetical protein [Alphaproteobacteria bacterium]
MPRNSKSAPQRSAHRVTGATYLEEGGVLALELEGGGRLTTSNEKLRNALNPPRRHLIPAAPGTFRLYCAQWEGGLQIRKTAVIAWSN